MKDSFIAIFFYPLFLFFRPLRRVLQPTPYRKDVAARGPRLPGTSFSPCCTSGYDLFWPGCSGDAYNKRPTRSFSCARTFPPLLPPLFITPLRALDSLFFEVPAATPHGNSPAPFPSMYRDRIGISLPLPFPRFSFLFLSVATGVNERPFRDSPPFQLVGKASPPIPFSPSRLRHCTRSFRVSKVRDMRKMPLPLHALFHRVPSPLPFSGTSPLPLLCSHGQGFPASSRSPPTNRKPALPQTLRESPQSLL